MNKLEINMPPPLQVSILDPKTPVDKKITEGVKPEPPKPEVKKESLPITEKSPTTTPLSQSQVSIKPKEELVTEKNSKPEINPVRVITQAADTPEEIKTVNAPSPEKINAVTDDYSNTLATAIAKYKQYPKIAQMRGWQGLIVVELQINPQGGLIYSQIKKSSGYDVLDQEALEMIKRASPFPQPPEALRNKNFTVLVPISFKLE